MFKGNKWEAVARPKTQGKVNAWKTLSPVVSYAIHTRSDEAKTAVHGFCVGLFFRAHEPMKRCLKSAMFTLKMKILIAFKQIQQISQLINN